VRAQRLSVRLEVYVADLWGPSRVAPVASRSRTPSNRRASSRPHPAPDEEDTRGGQECPDITGAAEAIRVVPISLASRAGDSQHQEALVREIRHRMHSSAMIAVEPLSKNATVLAPPISKSTTSAAATARVLVVTWLLYPRPANLAHRVSVRMLRSDCRSRHARQRVWFAPHRSWSEATAAMLASNTEIGAGVTEADLGRRAFARCKEEIRWQSLGP